MPKGVIQAADDIAHDLQTDPSARSLYEYGTLARRLEPLQDGGAARQELHDEPHPRRGHERVGRREAPRGLRPPRASVQRVRHAPLPHVGDPERRAQGPDRRRARVRGLVGRGWAFGLTDRDSIAWLNTELDKACLDVNEFGWMCGWVMECQEKGYITREQLGLRAALGRRQGRPPADPDDLEARGLRRPPRRGRQARGGEARRSRQGLRDLHRAGRRAARPRPPRALGGDARHLHLRHGHHGDRQPRPSHGAGAARARSIRSTASRWPGTWRASAGAGTSRTRWGSASSPSGRGWRTSAGP